MSSCDVQWFIDCLPPARRRASKCVTVEALQPLLDRYNAWMSELPKGADIQVQCGLRLRGTFLDQATKAVRLRVLAEIRVVEANEGRELFSDEQLMRVLEPV